jgi:hypothetical protein
MTGFGLEFSQMVQHSKEKNLRDLLANWVLSEKSEYEFDHVTLLFLSGCRSRWSYVAIRRETSVDSYWTEH